MSTVSRVFLDATYALILLVGSQDGHPAYRKPMPLIPEVVFWNKLIKETQGKPADPDSTKNRQSNRGGHGREYAVL